MPCWAGLGRTLPVRVLPEGWRPFWNALSVEGLNRAVESMFLAALPGYVCQPRPSRRRAWPGKEALLDPEGRVPGGTPSTTLLGVTDGTTRSRRVGGGPDTSRRFRKRSCVPRDGGGRVVSRRSPRMRSRGAAPTSPSGWPATPEPACDGASVFRRKNEVVTADEPARHLASAYLAEAVTPDQSAPRPVYGRVTSARSQRT